MSAFNSYGSSYTSFSTVVPETTPAAEKVRRHPKYYLNGGDMHFLVENYIFRVHRYFFERESAVFREKLNIAPPPGQNPKGSTETNPLPLDDVREVDFARFLWVFYNPKYSVYDANVDEWSSILKLSYEWKFAEVKRLACRYLEKFDIDPIQKIELYQLYELDRRLLIPSYIALINRQEPLSIAEGRRLSLETALLIATARECARGKPMETGRHSPTVASVNKETMVEIIKEVFSLANSSPSSPSLEPIFEGSGPSAFAATPLSPSKLVTSPPRHGAMSPTPRSKSLKSQSTPQVITPHSQPQPQPQSAPEASLPGESPTKPNMPPVPPYLGKLFEPLNSPTVKPSPSSDSSKDTPADQKEKPKDPKQNDPSAPIDATTTTSVPTGTNPLKIGQSVTPQRQPSLPPQQPPPLPLPSLVIPTDSATTRDHRLPPTPSQMTPSRRTKPTDPAPQTGTMGRLLGSARNWLGSSTGASPVREEERTRRRDEFDPRKVGLRNHPSSEYRPSTTHVTNTAHGAGTQSHEYNDISLKNVQNDSVNNAAPAAHAEAATRASHDRDVPAPADRVITPSDVQVDATVPPITAPDAHASVKNSEPVAPPAESTSDAASKPVIKGVEAAANEAGPASADTREQPAETQAAVDHPEQPTDAPAATAEKDKTESVAEVASGQANPEVPSIDVQQATPAASDAEAADYTEAKAVVDVAAEPAVPEGETAASDPAKPVAADTADLVDLSAEPVQQQAGDTTADNAGDAWDLDDADGAFVDVEDPQTNADDAQQAETEIFKDAVVVQPPSTDSDEDDVPLGVLAQQKQSSSSTEAATLESKEEKPAESKAASEAAAGDKPPTDTARPEPAANVVDATAVPPAAEVKEQESKASEEASSGPEQSASAGDAQPTTSDDPKRPAETDNKDAPTAPAAADDATSKATKPELHVKTEADNAEDAGAEGEEAGVVESSVPKHMLDDAEGAASTESESPTRAGSPVAAKKAPKKKKKKGGK